jgi:N-acetylglucosaminyl-diphospho-decaprenol L-rhamnosyltransferase
MDLSIIIVNWNSTEFTRNCIASIESTARNMEYEIVVVDNASTDASCGAITEAFPRVKLIVAACNLGFARANNLGVEHSRGRKILFLNPDTVVLENAIQRMMSKLDSAPGVGAVGCRLLNGDLTLQTSCVQPFPSILNQALSIDWLMRRWPTLPIWGRRALYSEKVGVAEVETVSGACIMIKREVFETIGGFSLDYFMYAEDKDLCYKVKKAGWKVGYVADAEIVHFGGQSTKKKKETGFSAVVMRESGFKFLRKSRGAAYAHAYRLVTFASAIVRLVVLSPLLAAPSFVFDRSAVLRAFTKWRRIARWSLGFEGWARQLGSDSTVQSTTAKR